MIYYDRKEMSMKIKIHDLIFPISSILILLISSCSGMTKPAPTSSPKATQTSIIQIKKTQAITVSPTFTPITPNTLTSTGTPTPDFCNTTQWQTNGINVLSNDLFDALRPGGPNTFDHILISQNPSWEGFQQEIEEMDGKLWTAGQIFDSFAWGYELGTGVNPAVILVTYGVEKDWELPKEGDLVSKVDQIRGQLHSYWGEIARNEIDLSQFPNIANGATYTLYRYFNGDSKILEDWCRTYVDVFGEAPFKENDH